MDALSLLRYWRNNGGDGTTNANVRTTTTTATGNTTTIVTGVNSQASETGDEEDDENDHGPFFDLEFSLPAEGDEGGDEEREKNEETENGSDYGEEEDDDDDEDSDGSERELKFTLVSGSSGDSNNSTADLNVSVSPSDDLFFKGGFVPVEHTTETKSTPPQFRLSLLKSATKIRVMMLKFKKSKFNLTESTDSGKSNASGSSNSNNEQKENQENEADQNGESTDSAKSMTVKFNIEEVPIVSLFKRHNSSKPPKKQQNENESVSEEKKFTKETMQRYFRKVKPLYVRVSKKYGEKLKFAGQISFPGASKPNFVPPATTEEQKQSPAANPEVSEPPLLLSTAKGLKQGNLPAGLRVVCKHFGKTWSASAPAAAAAPPVTISSKRLDDSLLQQQDGIQSAILHCKRSFKASRDADCSSSVTAASSGGCENSLGSDAADGKEAEEMNRR
ncbi:hypothetical protein L1987_05118 [Smallanthus sonchifolius]|uniref:Uncharacterized protein n=1 Tax=Smallanthus sonchifolius TaxID=185202 RepID=A0ACB9JUH9_9ASTR|nr:hypothetical protein L1987_05118 [Smallanthus sonchifolius]